MALRAIRESPGGYALARSKADAAQIYREWDMGRAAAVAALQPIAAGQFIQFP